MQQKLAVTLEFISRKSCLGICIGFRSSNKIETIYDEMNNFWITTVVFIVKWFKVWSEPQWFACFRRLKEYLRGASNLVNMFQIETLDLFEVHIDLCYCNPKKFKKERYTCDNIFFPVILKWKCSAHSETVLVGNKAKGRISKRVFQENKARQIFRKTNIFYPLILTRTYLLPTY